MGEEVFITYICNIQDIIWNFNIIFLRLDSKGKFPLWFLEKKGFLQTALNLKNLLQKYCQSLTNEPDLLSKVD